MAVVYNLAVPSETLRPGETWVVTEYFELLEFLGVYDSDDPIDARPSEAQLREINKWLAEHEPSEMLQYSLAEHGVGSNGKYQVTKPAKSVISHRHIH